MVRESLGTCHILVADLTHSPDTGSVYGLRVTELKGTDSALYLILLRRALTGALYGDSDHIRGEKDGVGRFKQRLANRIGEISSNLEAEIVRRHPYDVRMRERSLDRAARADPMIELRRMVLLDRSSRDG